MSISKIGVAGIAAAAFTAAAAVSVLPANDAQAFDERIIAQLQAPPKKAVVPFIDRVWIEDPSRILGVRHNLEQYVKCRFNSQAGCAAGEKPAVYERMFDVMRGSGGFGFADFDSYMQPLQESLGPANFCLRYERPDLGAEGAEAVVVNTLELAADGMRRGMSPEQKAHEFRAHCGFS